jgi:hypothetical protein
MQEHVKWNTAKEADDYLDLRIRNKVVLMMKFHLVGVGWGWGGLQTLQI